VQRHIGQSGTGLYGLTRDKLTSLKPTIKYAGCLAYAVLGRLFYRTAAWKFKFLGSTKLVK
jgi:hypothetical protein